MRTRSIARAFGNSDIGIGAQGALQVSNWSDGGGPQPQRDKEQRVGLPCARGSVGAHACAPGPWRPDAERHVSASDYGPDTLSDMGLPPNFLELAKTWSWTVNGGTMLRGQRVGQVCRHALAALIGAGLVALVRRR